MVVERLRDRMKREMDLRGFRPRTQRAYLRVCRKMSEYFGCSPMRLGSEDVKRYVHHLIVGRKLSSSTVNVVVSGLRVLFGAVLGREEVCASLPRRKRERRLPEVLSV